MPRVKTIIPGIPSREKGQRSLDDMYISRFIPPWAQPLWERAEFWRAVVARLPAATVCKEYIISNISSLDWKIEPRESTQREELKEEIIYHTELFEAGGYYNDSGWDFLKMIEFGLSDALDLPFGTAFETIREGDKKDGRVLYILPIDGSTLSPTWDRDWPVFQRIQSNPTQTVVFPAHAINRFYYSPRTEIKMEGWGMPPPEKIFLAMEMIRRGDIYFSKFLSDTPEAGVLDLMDMDQESAEEWVSAFKNLFTGIEPMKIPVLYEHTTAAKWIPFGKDPNSLQFQQTYHQYVTLTCAGYGISPTDIGFPSKGGGGGETMSGAIRDDRRTKKTGIARTKLGLQYWFNRMLPKTLKFTWIDLDDEVSVALGRARLANATAFSQYINLRMISPKEARLQTIADGLITIPVPEDVPEDEFKVLEDAQQNANERPGMLGSPINPSQGGKGEIVNRSLFDDFLLDILDIPDVKIRKLAKAILPSMEKELNTVLSDLDPSEYRYWIDWHNQVLWGNITEDIPELTLSTIELSRKPIKQIIQNEKWLSFDTSNLTKVTNDLASMAGSIYVVHQVSQSQSQYENGKSESYVSESEVEVPDEFIKTFKSWARREIRQFISELDISKSVIIGLRNSIIKTGLVELLDKDESLSDNNVVSNVRYALAEYYHMKLQEFYKIIDQYLEEYLDGKSS